VAREGSYSEIYALPLSKHIKKNIQLIISIPSSLAANCEQYQAEMTFFRVPSPCPKNISKAQSVES
jgi:hypothetical protein